jgi:GrpB-like predicted nucleotidyltransferase (UPF0157 family)
MSVVEDDFELIGGREAHPVVIADHDPEWSERFAVERDRIADALGDSVTSIHHIGSTSVPGLAAKPIVDVLVELADPTDEATFVPQLAAAGYELRVRESGHRCFRTHQRDVHVHVWVERADVDRHLLFRDRLRASATDRARYEARKRELAREQWDDMNDYAQAKNDVVSEIHERAIAWDADGRPPVS